MPVTVGSGWCAEWDGSALTCFKITARNCTSGAGRNVTIAPDPTPGPDGQTQIGTCGGDGLGHVLGAVGPLIQNSQFINTGETRCRACLVLLLSAICTDAALRPSDLVHAASATWLRRPCVALASLAQCLAPHAMRLALGCI